MSIADERTELPDGVLRMERLEYRGKRYQVPIFDAADPVVLRPAPANARHDADPEQLVLQSIHGTWDLAQFQRPRRPVSLGLLDPAELARFTRPGVARVLDMP